MTLESRESVLRRIRTALGRETPSAPAAPAPPTLPDYRQRAQEPHDTQVDQFVERVREYRATVERVAPGALAAACAAACAARGVRTLVVPPDVPEPWLAELPAADVTIRRDTALSPAELDSSDAVLSGCRLGIAQTGTIVLDHGPTQGRRALTLVPDVHFCVVRAEQIVGLVPEAVAQLAPTAREERRPLTFISGPSATSDIELSRVEGVHGPRTLHVFVVDASLA
jgi:L-lactate dehydrogenase complex protein LldG